MTKKYNELASEYWSTTIWQVITAQSVISSDNVQPTDSYVCTKWKNLTELPEKNENKGADKTS